MGAIYYLIPSKHLRSDTHRFGFTRSPSSLKKGEKKPYKRKLSANINTACIVVGHTPFQKETKKLINCGFEKKNGEKTLSMGEREKGEEGSLSGLGRTLCGVLTNLFKVDSALSVKYCLP